METSWLNALMGGSLIGISVSLMLFWNGRATGISGILYGLFRKTPGDIAWRFYFLGGLIFGGIVLRILRPESFGSNELAVNWTVGLAGLLVGFGTTLGSGCTSGHGICGISRFSPRSFLATLIFMGSGILTVFAVRMWGSLP
jgi:uncharacterized membrane protein YedE/YeeE